MNSFQFSKKRGYTLIELMVALGLFAIIMLISSGAYLIMINLNRQAQGIATGIDNLSFALETMTRTIRTGSAYNCDTIGDCLSGGTSFSFKNTSGVTVSYSRAGDSSIQETINGVTRTLTDPLVKIDRLTFYAYGTRKFSTGDYEQPRVSIIVSGTVTYGPNKTQTFNVETGATMRGTDI